MSTSIHDLPNELLAMILDGSNSQKVIYSFVSKTWLSFIDTRYLWVVRDILMREFSETESLPLIQWAYNQGCPIDDNFFSEAITIGNINILDWWSQHKNFSRLCGKAASEGRLDILIWMKSKGYVLWCIYNVFSSAAYRGHLEVIKYLRSESYFWDEGTCYFAAAGGHLEVLQWVRANGCPWNENTLHAALKNNHLEVYKWAKDNGCPTDDSICWAAAKIGNLELVRETYRRTCRRMVCNWAAKGGHMDILNYLRERGCVWDETVTSGAAKGGHFELLKWLRQEDCPWDKYTVRNAAKNGHLNILKWALENGCSEGKGMYTAAAKGRRIEILDWLWNNGYRSFTQSCYKYAIINRQIELIKWLHEHDCPEEWKEIFGWDE